VLLGDAQTSPPPGPPGGGMPRRLLRPGRLARGRPAGAHL